MDWFHQDLGLLTAHAAFTLGGVQYPGGWLLSATAEERTALGFVPVQMGQKPNERFYHVGQPTAELIFGVCYVKFSSVPRDMEDAVDDSGVVINRGLKSRAIYLAKQAANTLLQPTDWKVIRAAEGAKPLEESVTAYRANVRAASDAYETAVLACGTVAELEVLPPPAWPQA